MQQVIRHPRIGEVTLSRTRRAHRLSVSVRPPGRVRLTLPARMPLREGLAFLDEKADWVIETLRRVAERHPVRLLLPPYRTWSHELELVEALGERPSAWITADRIRVALPAGMAPETEEGQQVIRAAVERTLRCEAKEVLSVMTAEIARRFGFRYGRVTVRAARGRWGSCSSHDDLSFSIFLMRLPRHLIEYVILHELCHTRFKDHSPRFHALLDRLLEGREKALRAELRSHAPEVI